MFHQVDQMLNMSKVNQLQKDLLAFFFFNLQSKIRNKKKMDLETFSPVSQKGKCRNMFRL